MVNETQFQMQENLLIPESGSEKGLRTALQV
jgi:hypothetical protein